MEQNASTENRLSSLHHTYSHFSSEQRMREHQRSQHASPGSLNSSDKRSTVKDNRETKARRNEWRITKMVLAIFLSFLVCYLPITIAKVADSHVHYPGKFLHYSYFK